MFYTEGQATFKWATQTGIPRGTLEIVIQESFMVDTGIFFSNMNTPITNVKCHSDPWPTVTSQPIRLSTNFMTFIPSLTFNDYERFPWSICNGRGMPAKNAYPSGHLVPSPIVGLACAPIIVETRFLELAMSLLDFSPWIPLGTFSILLKTEKFLQYERKLSLYNRCRCFRRVAVYDVTWSDLARDDIISQLRWRVYSVGDRCL